MGKYDEIKIPKVTTSQYTGRSAKYGQVKKEVDYQGAKLIGAIIIGFTLLCILFLMITRIVS